MDLNCLHQFQIPSNMLCSKNNFVTNNVFCMVRPTWTRSELHACCCEVAYSQACANEHGFSKMQLFLVGACRILFFMNRRMLHAFHNIAFSNNWLPLISSDLLRDVLVPCVIKVATFWKCWAEVLEHFDMHVLCVENKGNYWRAAVLSACAKKAYGVQKYG